MKLYNLEYCSYCVRVRRRLDELGISYEKIDVPLAHHLRTEVIQVSGQPTVPVLVDGDVVLDDEDEIIEYLDTTYGKEQETR
jgi:glutathione S-transferase